MENVVPLFGYGVHDFFWGKAIRDERTKEWVNIFIVDTQGMQELDVRGMGFIIHENGIEFVR